MNKPGIALLGIVFLTGSLGLATTSLADPEDHMGYGRHHIDRGEHMGYGQHHSDSMPHHGYGKKENSWKRDLSDEQRKEIDKLRLAYKQKKYLLKSKIKQAKVEFALLITQDSPDQSAINKKIDQITKLKSEKLRLKADHKISVRKVLTSEQRVKFDMAVLNKAYKGKGRGHHGR
ncbi:Spy/CpxP family protein refolding chaperone [Kaarinaea lacus]